MIQFSAAQSQESQKYDFPMGYAGGMNTTESADLIGQNQSPDMCNVNYDAGGVPSKRTGFTAVNSESYGAYTIRGLFEFEKADGTLILLAAYNGKFWSINGTTGAATDLCTGAKSSIADTQVDGFSFNGKFYFLTGTEYCYYDGTNPVAVVVGYIPTVYLGRSPTGGGTIYEAYNLLSNSWKDSFTGTSAATVYQLSLTNLTSVDYVWVNGVLKTVTTDYTVDLTAGTVTFGTAPGEGTDNVVIQATKAGIKDATIITKCTFHAIYGGQNDTRLFFSGNPTYKNYRFQSGLMDPTYFPDDGDQAIPSSDAETIKGFGKMGNYLVTLGEYKRFWTDVTSDSGTVVFTINPLNDQYGCTNWRTAALAQDGLLCLSYQGVTWTHTTGVKSQLNTKMISKNINYKSGTVDGLLNATKAQLELAFAYVYQNKYYLHIGSTVWVLDLDYSSLSQGIYCWYKYTGLYSTLAQMLERQDGLLWVGDTAGKIYKSNTLYNDNLVAIDAWWTSPMIYGDRAFIKKFERLNLTFGGQSIADHILTFLTDEGGEENNLFSQDTRSFNYGGINYGVWTYGAPFYPSTQSEKVGFKGEYFQWKVRNDNVDEKLVILSQNLIYHNVKRVK